MSNIRTENEMTYTTAMTKEQKLIFLKTLVALAKADTKIDGNEKDFLKGMSLVFNLPQEDIDIKHIPSEDEVVDMVKVIKDRKLAMNLIKEMCMLANFDGDMSDEEIVLIGRVGEAMGLSVDKIQDISQWVIDRIVLQERGKIIFEQFN